jgi:hypothetical protein
MIYRGAGGLTLDFLQASDSTDPAMAGVWGALKGSFLTIVVTMALAFPVGVLSAIYLEEFASRNRWTDIIEVNIPTGVPLVYLLNEDLKPLQKYYLGNQEAVQAKMAAVANPGKSPYVEKAEARRAPASEPLKPDT